MVNRILGMYFPILTQRLSLVLGVRVCVMNKQYALASQTLKMSTYTKNTVHNPVNNIALKEKILSCQRVFTCLSCQALPSYSNQELLQLTRIPQEQSMYRPAPQAPRMRCPRLPWSCSGLPDLDPGIAMPITAMITTAAATAILNFFIFIFLQ
jgi:hypothetical protein